MTHDSPRLRSAAAGLLAAVLSAPTALAAHETLTIVSWGGAYTASQMRAYVNPFRERVDYPVEVIDYNGGLEEIRAQTKALNVKWDVVDIGLSNAIRGCDAGLLEPLDHDLLQPAPDGTPPERDFRPGSLQPCGIGQNVFSTVVAYDTTAFPGRAPARVEDFFDADRFPGRRGLRRNPQVILEWALMADGAPAERVYSMLETDAGLQRAFSQLDRIKPYIVWWDGAGEPTQLLAEGRVVMTQSYNGRAQDAVDSGADVAILWDGQVMDVEMWVVPRGAPHRRWALEFIRFATAPERQAEQARHIAYGPARHSAQEMLDAETARRLPTAPVNAATALQADFDWWAEHGERIEERFEAWIKAGPKVKGPSGTAL
jgi:putative spermidine/putrescine transport system substrate-binding protein